MPEMDAIEFVNDVTSDTGEVHERVLDAGGNRELTVEIHEVDRKFLLDQINKLPDEMMDTLSEAENEEEAQELAEEGDMLSGVTGDTVEAFENICVESLDHDDLTPHHFEQLVEGFSFEVLFELGAEIIEMSFSDENEVKDFRKPDSDKNS